VLDTLSVLLTIQLVPSIQHASPYLDESLKQAFAGMGVVSDAKVITDRYTGRSRGFGFVTFQTPEDADKALAQMNGVEVDGRNVRVDRASSRN